MCSLQCIDPNLKIQGIVDDDGTFKGLEGHNVQGLI